MRNTMRIARSSQPYVFNLIGVGGKRESRFHLVPVFQNSLYKCRTFLTREAMWELPPPLPKAGPQGAAVAMADNGGGKRTQQNRLGQPTKVAKTFRDGTKLCQQFQRGACKNRACKEKHVCASVMRSGRVCGGSHPAKLCRNKLVERK